MHSFPLFLSNYHFRFMSRGHFPPLPAEHFVRKHFPSRSKRGKIKRDRERESEGSEEIIADDLSKVLRSRARCSTRLSAFEDIHPVPWNNSPASVTFRFQMKFTPGIWVEKQAAKGNRSRDSILNTDVDGRISLRVVYIAAWRVINRGKNMSSAANTDNSPLLWTLGLG